MRRSRFTEEQIIAILAEQERGLTTAEVCRRYGISSPTFYKWKAKFGGMEVSDARKLKKLLAEAMLEAWRDDYNHCRPHGRLGWLTPAAYAARWAEKEELEGRPSGPFDDERIPVPAG
jgi:putative transposase